MPLTLKESTELKSKLKNLLKKHLLEEITEGSKWIKIWDGINEVVNNFKENSVIRRIKT